MDQQRAVTLNKLRELFGAAAMDALARRIQAGKSPQIDPILFGLELSGKEIEIDTVRFLDKAAEAHVIQRIETWHCPVQSCTRAIDNDDVVTNQQCPYCKTDFRETGETPVKGVVYRVNAGNSRTVPWLIAIHGFNSRGPWQEELSWLIANRNKHHVPVLIYKYGKLQLGVLFRRWHLVLAHRLGARIRKAVAHASNNQINEPPDVLIHSFGSQLFRIVLELEEFSDLRFGRVIAAGSVIRPDFDWSTYIASGRIEAVLNQCGGRDKAVPLAQFTIPRTGPGGRHGFTDPAVINVLNESYAHSTALTEDELNQNLRREGIWDRYLREPLISFDDPAKFISTTWRPVSALLRWPIRAIIFLILPLFAAIALTISVRALCELAAALMSI